VSKPHGEFADRVTPSRGWPSASSPTLAWGGGQLTPLEGTRRIPAAVATLFGYDEFILDEILSTTLAASPSWIRV
jgi:hypothetical protein